ncbi:hypothetical protein [Actinoplanes sp. NPDC049599]|uniref:hypothetical protein n=1 Tax=Actinoplanes sp. NPDC049599 TaxID=3363903 RepID=UPI0037B75755
MNTGKRLLAIGLLLALEGCTSHAPDEAPETSAPAVPPVAVDVPAEFVGWWDGPGPDDSGADPGQAPNNLIGPHYGVRVSQVKALPLLPLDAARRAALRQPAGASPLQPPTTTPMTLRAAPGQQFVLAWLASQAGLDGQVATGLGAVNTTVSIGGRSVALGKLPTETVLMVSAPQGAEVRLVTGDPGHLQSLDLRTGKRRTGPPAVYADFPSYLGGTSSGSPGYARLRAKGQNYSTTLFQWEAVRKPWAGGLGYAPRGKAWLAVVVKLATQRDVTDSGELSLSLDPATAFRVGGSKPVPGSVKRVADEENEEADYSFVVAVDDDFGKGTLHISLDGGELLVGGKPRQFSVVETKGLSVPFTLR